MYSSNSTKKVQTKKKKKNVWDCLDNNCMVAFGGGGGGGTGYSDDRLYSYQCLLSH